MERDKTAAEAIQEQLALPNPAGAMLFVDGYVVGYCDNRQEADNLSDEAEKQFPEWREIAIMVYKPRYNMYLRERHRSRG